MLNIALTGNIAAGKTAVVELFRRWGATVIDADELAREAQAPGSATLASIAGRFGADVLAPDGTLDRPALRAKVMGDDAALAALNAIVHPVVRRRRGELQRAALDQGDLLLVNDTPLLFEALDPDEFDVIVLVDAPAEVRRARLRALRRLAYDDADRMIAAQMPSERKRPRSDFVIDNDGSLAELEPMARAVFEALRERAARTAWSATASPVALVADGTRDPDAAILQALGGALGSAGVATYRVAGKAPTIQKALQAKPPATVVTTAAAATSAMTALRRMQAQARVHRVDPNPEPGREGTIHDLRPWGGTHVMLVDNPLA